MRTDSLRGGEIEKRVEEEKKLTSIPMSPYMTHFEHSYHSSALPDFLDSSQFLFYFPLFGFRSASVGFNRICVEDFIGITSFVYFYVVRF